MDLTIEISSRAAQRLAEGYLWIFSNEVLTKEHPEKGTWCTFVSQGKVVGCGYANPHSLIYGRVLSNTAEASIPALLERRLEAAFLRRKYLLPLGSARLVFSESDFLPGLILDWYGGILVLQSNSAGIDSLLPILTELIPSVYRRLFPQELKGFVVRSDSGIRSLEGIDNKNSLVFGDEKSIVNGEFSEGDIRYAADFLNGQKTGFFLDQRDNRTAWGKALMRNPPSEVLDLCSYSGGWGLRALKAGAKKVTFVDQSKEALELVQRGLRLNGFNESRAEIIQMDVFDFLEKNKNQYDAIVSDPPAFVKSKKVLPQAKRAYEKLNKLAWRSLVKGGLLFTCSCSYHLSEEDFFELLWGAFVKENRKALIFYRGGQAEDHPIYLSMPETRYLKCLGIQKV